MYGQRLLVAIDWSIIDYTVVGRVLNSKLLFSVHAPAQDAFFSGRAADRAAANR